MIIAGDCIGESFMPEEVRYLHTPLPFPGWIGNFDHQVSYKLTLTTEPRISITKNEFKYERAEIK
jgi:hypothetical protein